VEKEISMIMSEDILIKGNIAYFIGLDLINAKFARKLILESTS